MALAGSRTGSASSRAPVARPAGSAGRLAVGAGLLELQAAAGNAAVAQLVQRTRVDATKQGHYGNPAVGAGLVELQAAAGNAAVARLVQRPQVQRADAGWDDAKKQGHYWNAGKRTVGSVDRFPLQLDSGGFGGAGLDSESAKMTSESARNRAIALVPQGLKPDQPVTVFLHFHGHVEDAGKRPYASWREHVADERHQERSGKVRDVAHDQIVQQIEAAGDPQVLGVLPVGVGASMFARSYNDFAGGPYLEQVFKALADVGATKTRIPLDKAQVVLGAHSGGGFTVNSMLAAATAEAEGKKVKGMSTAGARIAEVAIFEAAIDKGRWKTVWAWARSHLDRLAAVLDSQADPAKKVDAIKATPRLRAYYGRSYVKPHEDLAGAIAGWFDDPFAPNGTATGRTNRAAVGGYLDDVAALFRVVHVPGVGHEEIVRGHALADKAAADAGSVTDALKALHDPKAGPIPGLGTVATPTPKAAAKRKVKADAAAPKPPTGAAAGASLPSQTAGSAAKGATDVTISWGSNAKRDAVADSSLAILKDVVRAAGLSQATITSTARNATDQARAMYQNLVGPGVAKQKKLYGPAGDKVIDVFVALRDEGKSPQEIKDGMRDAIVAIGPSKVSRHCGDPTLLNVFDVGPNSLGDDEAKKAFNAAAAAEVGVRVAKYIPFPRDPGDHFEIKPSGGTAPAPAAGAPKVEAPAPKPAPAPAPAAPTPVPAKAPDPKPPAPRATGGAVAKAAGWKESDATASYALTAEQRAALNDHKELKAQAKRLKELRKAEKAGTLTADDAKDLATLQALEARVKRAGKLEFQREDTEEVLAAAGKTVKDWYSDIVEGSFLGIPLKVHKELAERLDRAQSALVGDATINPTEQSAADLGKTLKMYASKSDMRAPKAATGGTKLSLHTFGLAVDLNYAGNPMVGNKKPAKPGKDHTPEDDKRYATAMAARTPRLVERAMWLMKSKAFDIEAENAVSRGKNDVGAAWDAHREASDALVAYLRLAADVESTAFADRVKACGEPTGVKWDQPTTGAWWNDVAWWKKRVTDDKGLADTYDFSEDAHHGKAVKTGYMDLAKEVVVALVGAGLYWGGQYGEGAKDIMHFDWRSGGDAAKINEARGKDKPNH
jgi:hypothetical protein